VFRAGGVAFYELGGAGNDLEHMPLHQDVGLGLRTLIPQTSREVFRFDFAIPLDGSAAGKLRFIAGFESAF
jgi:outer membrane translocation and assembly module TamA